MTEEKEEKESKVIEEDEFKRAKIYLQENQEVHLSLKNGSFYNGYIVELSTEFIIFKDNMLGKMPIFFRELKRSIEPRRKEVE